MNKRYAIFTVVGALALVIGALVAAGAIHFHAPERQGGENKAANTDAAKISPLNEAALKEMVTVPAGRATIGADTGLARERPVFVTQVSAFYLDRIPVTVAQFEKFVEKTGYVTDDERLGNGAVMSMVTGQWSLVDGATWRKPLGPKEAQAKPDHPVTQVSWNDANAYCLAQGKRLPTEVEWEYAARFGQPADSFFPFEGKLVDKKGYKANVWTGVFPVLNTAEDGYRYTAPVRAFPANKLGLYDMAGNVWEWVADWYRPYERRNAAYKPGPESKKVQRGGSFLCDPNFCYGFRVTAREGATPESAFIHVGFRCAADANARVKSAEFSKKNKTL